MDEITEEKKKRGIPPLTLKIMVSAYLLWVIQELIIGIFKGEMEGKTAVLFGVISVVLLIATVGLFFPEIRTFLRNRKKGPDDKK